MTEFKLCEEMGLKVQEAPLLHPFVYASDVEKMLAGGRRDEAAEVCPNRHVVTGNYFDQITLKIPQKPKPVTKKELENQLWLAIQALKLFKLNDNLTPLLERIAKAGIE
jgi:hypothetical protein